MCRFLLVRSKKKIYPEKFLLDFASACQKSHAPDGDWQGDGWGIALQNENWETYKSLNPIWVEENKFKKFGETNTFAVHARSAGFAQHKGILEYNQPYVSDDICFVFNGMIKGVHLPFHVDGSIGAQKIFSLIKQESKTNSLDKVLHTVDATLLNNSKHIEGMNIGLSYKDKFIVLCEYAENQDYFGIRYFQDNELVVVSSLTFGNFHWEKMKKGDISIF